jgi:hypothetical protein
VGAEGASCAQQASVRRVNRLAVAASRILEVMRANGIYSSPIVKTTWIKALLQKKQILTCAARPNNKTCSSIDTQRDGGRFLKTGMKTAFRDPMIAFD